MVVKISVDWVVLKLPVHGVNSVVAVWTSGALITIKFSVVGIPSLPVTVVMVVSVLVDEKVHASVVVTTGTGHSAPSGAIKI